MADPLLEQDSVVRCGCSGRRWMLAVAGVALVAGVVIAAVRYRSGHDALMGPPALKASGKDLKSTVITPHLEAPIQPGKNILWCSTFQLVWNEACHAAGGDLRLQDEPPMVSILNKKAASSADVDPSSCLVMSGLVQDGIIAKIRRELKIKLDGQANPGLLNKIEARLPPDGWLGYADLFCSLPFEHIFTRLQKPLTFQSAKVASFGLSDIGGAWGHLEKARQVVVLDYVDNDSFVLELKPKDNSERIILAKVAPADTLRKTIETVQSHIDTTKLEVWQRRLEFRESIVVPILNFDLSQEYEELYNKLIKTSGPLQGNPIVLAMQSIRFRFDERGAVLKSGAGYAAACAVPEKPRQFIFDRPFLILLERRGAARPYFALWVDNPELLVPWK